MFTSSLFSFQGRQGSCDRWPRRRIGQHPVDQGIGGQSLLMPGDDLMRQTPNILDQHDAQGDRNRPQLANHQRLDGLISLNKAR